RRPLIQGGLHQLIYLLPTFRSHKNRGEWGMGRGEWGTRGQGEGETGRQEMSFSVSPCLLVPLSPCLPFPTPYSLVISRSNQAFPVFQSRVTVGTETQSASAVSSRLRPPK